MTNLPPTVDRATFDEQLSALRTREKAHTREGDAIAAARPVGGDTLRTNGRPISHWSRLAAGRSDNLSG